MAVWRDVGRWGFDGGCFSSCLDSDAIARSPSEASNSMGLILEARSSFIHSFFFFFYFHESVAYGKAVKCGLFLSVFLDSDGQPLHRSPVEGAGLHMLPFLYILYP